MTEARRQLSVCNACRYCEGYCATFLAIESRPALKDADVALIANICHDCRGCYQACMYTPPHEFAIDIPTLLSTVRADTYRTYTWPRRAEALFRHPSASAVAGGVFGIVFVVLVALAAGEPTRLTATDLGAGSFYRVVPSEAMIAAAAVAALYALCIWIVGAVRFSRDAGVELGALVKPGRLLRVAKEGLTLRWMNGGGDGCFYPDPERHSNTRRGLHVLVVLGFLSANVSTASAAATEHLLGVLPPYPVLSVPVLFGIAGGLAMIAGTTGLLALKARASGALISREMLQMDWVFLVVFDLVSLSGMATLALRATPFMSAALLVHLGTLVMLFLAVPYGKFAHALYRLVALFWSARDLDREARLD